VPVAWGGAEVVIVLRQRIEPFRHGPEAEAGQVGSRTGLAGGGRTGPISSSLSRAFLGPVGSRVRASAARLRFEEACAQIGAGLGDAGFRYLKSKRQAKKVIGDWTQVVSFQSSFRNTADDLRLWAWYWIDSEQVRRWRRLHGAVADSGRVFGCALGYLGDPATFTGWNVAGDFMPVVRDVVDRVREGAGRVSDVIMDVPAFLDRVSDSDLTFFDPGQVVDLLAAHGCREQIGAYLGRLSGGFQSTGTVRTDGVAVLAAARRFLAAGARANHAGADLVEALSRADCAHLLAEPLPGGGPA
jgi:hypothetical protein